MVQHAILSWNTDASAKGEVLSNEGGRVHRVDDLTLVRRFLILGSTGTFYATGFKVTQEATAAVDRAVKADPQAVLDLVLDVSRNRLALRNDPTLYALARLTLPDVTLDVRRAASGHVAEVARIGTDLLHWISYRRGMGKSNRLFRKAIQNWFTSRTPDDLALQAVKYDQRDGWSMRDALRLARPVEPTPEYGYVFDWMAHPDKRVYDETIRVGDTRELSRLFGSYRRLRQDTGVDVPRVIQDNRLPREAVPGELLQHRETWEALLPDMPARALVRNLGKLASLGVVDDGVNRDDILRKIDRAAKVLHPYEFLVAAKMHAQGRGERGKLSWQPHPEIVEALMVSFGKAFGELPVWEQVKPIIALDVSGSMSQSAGGTALSCVEAEAALAMVLAHQFPRAEFVVYSHQLTPIDMHGRSYQQIKAAIDGWKWSFGATLCDLPLQHALDHASIDAAVSITDSETWASRRSPSDLVRMIHDDGRPEFRHAVVGMATNDISIADPDDPHQMDFVGMSADLPVALARFLAGEA